MSVIFVFILFLYLFLYIKLIFAVKTHITQLVSTRSKDYKHFYIKNTSIRNPVMLAISFPEMKHNSAHFGTSVDITLENRV